MKNMKRTVFIVICVISTFAFSSHKKHQKVPFFPKLSSYCQGLTEEFDLIPEDRKSELNVIADFVKEQRSAHQPANLLFVCTSNSRRSHMAQVWSQIASYYYGVDSVYTFSGGTEQTRVNVNAIEAFKRTGIQIHSNDQGDNPLRYVIIGKAINPWAIFSKKYTDGTNPKSNFAAVMVCSEADHSCPYVEGAELRIGLPYLDPKEFDNSPLKEEKYDERCRQIAREMFYIMDLVSKK
jgi:arsenate reductase (thioredoxin)